MGPLKCKCGHTGHANSCLVRVGLTECGCKVLPPPTDDELLLAFVEECPSMAIDNYRRRVGLDWRLTPYFLYEHLEREWQHRMGTK